MIPVVAFQLIPLPQGSVVSELQMLGGMAVLEYWLGLVGIKLSGRFVPFAGVLGCLWMVYSLLL